MFRFTIRDVLWLTVVVALLLGWARDHVELTKWHRLWYAREQEFYKENQHLRSENARLNSAGVAIGWRNQWQAVEELKRQAEFDQALSRTEDAPPRR